MTTSMQMSSPLLNNNKKADVMSQSLDPHILSNNFKNMSTGKIASQQQPPSQYPLMTASKMMPVPESLMSPDCGGPLTQELLQSKLRTTNAVGSAIPRKGMRSFNGNVLLDDLRWNLLSHFILVALLIGLAGCPNL